MGVCAVRRTVSIGIQFFKISLHRFDRFHPPVLRLKISQNKSFIKIPDGKYLFFMSARMPKPPALSQQVSFDYLRSFRVRPPNGFPAVWWVDASFLEKLRPVVR